MKHISFLVKVLAVILSVLLVVMGLPMAVFAEELLNMFGGEAEGITVSTDEDSVEEDTFALSLDPFEETELRTEKTKTFRLSDGSHYLAQYITDVHIKDAEGKWQDIDNTLKLADGFFSTSDRRFVLSEKAESDSLLLIRNFEKGVLRFSVQNPKGSVAGNIQEISAPLPEDAEILDRLTTLEKITSAVQYEKVWENTDLRYVISGNDVREYITVGARSDRYEYTFRIYAEGFSVKTEENGGIVFTAADSGEYACSIPAPVMWDAEKNISDKIRTSVSEEKTQDGMTVLTVTYLPSAEWMNASERKYPVTIDPPVIASRTNVTDLDVNTSDSQYSDPDSISLYAGAVWRAYWKLNTLPTLPLLARITDATITFFGYDGLNDAGGYIGVYNVLTDWDSTLTWGKVMNTANPQGQPAAVCTDYLKCPDDRTSCS